METHPNVIAVRDALDSAGPRTTDGTAPHVIILDDAVHTAPAAAAALGVEVGQIANSLVFDADGAPLLVLTSGAHRVDTAKVAAGLGLTKLRRATPEFVREHTGQAIGGGAPPGPPQPGPPPGGTPPGTHDQNWAAGGVPPPG